MIIQTTVDVFSSMCCIPKYSFLDNACIATAVFCYLRTCTQVPLCERLDRRHGLRPSTGNEFRTLLVMAAQIALRNCLCKHLLDIERCFPPARSIDMCIDKGI